MLFHLPEVVSTMWNDPSYPNTPTLIARPHTLANADPSAVFVAALGSFAGVDMPWLTSCGKVNPVDGQEHPRTEL